MFSATDCEILIPSVTEEEPAPWCIATRLTASVRGVNGGTAPPRREVPESTPRPCIRRAKTSLRYRSGCLTPCTYFRHASIHGNVTSSIRYTLCSVLGRQGKLPYVGELLFRETSSELSNHQAIKLSNLTETEELRLIPSFANAPLNWASGV